MSSFLKSNYPNPHKIFKQAPLSAGNNEPSERGCETKTDTQMKRAEQRLTGLMVVMARGREGERERGRRGGWV